MRSIAQVLAGLCLTLALPAAAGPRSVVERSVVVLVWDGMRPDFVRADTTPNLWALAQRGVVFRQHRAAYLSSTEVNGVVLATGSHPARNGIVANREYRPTIRPSAISEMNNLDVVEKGDALTKGRYIALPTLAAQVQAAGYQTAVAGTKGVALLQDRPAGRRAPTHPPSVDVFMSGGSDKSPGAVPPDALPAIHQALGVFPGKITYPNTAQDAWTTSVLIDHLWRDDVPAFSLLWLSDPDYTQHQSAPGAPEALAAIRSADAQLGRVVDALRARGMLDRTDLLVVSDHGFSTIDRSVDVAALMRDAGFDARREFSESPHDGQVMVVGNGGSVCLYLTDHDAAVEAKLVEYLQQSDFCGTIFSRSGLPGTFSLAEGFLNSADAPDVLFSLRWSDGQNAHGVPGMLFSDGRHTKGTGNHASLSRFDQHNTLVAAGPGFRKGLVSDIPSGNIDIAPTILHLLGLKPAERMDGRVLSEALAGEERTPKLEAKTERRQRTRDFEKTRWNQELQVTRCGGSVYLDEGTGVSVPK